MTGGSGPDYDHHEADDAHVDPLDDVFGSAPPSPAHESVESRPDEATITRPSALDPSDIPRLRSTHVTSGYREGIAVSKERHIQEGFDEGYCLGAELGMKAGWCLGALEGMWYALLRDAPSVEGENADEVSDGLSRAEIGAVRTTAAKELEVSYLCGRQYFGEDGIWLYDVPRSDSEEDPTLEQVAVAHPVLREWTQELAALSSRLHLEIGLK